MELINNFANLSRTFSARFPELKGIAPLYILAFLIARFDWDNLCFDFISGFSKLFNSKVLQDISEFN